MRIVAHEAVRKQFSEDISQDIIAHSVDNLCHKDIHGEWSHLLYRSEIEGKARAPFLDKEEFSDDSDRDVCYLLPYQSPIGLSEESKGDTSGARNYKGDKSDDCHLLVHHVLHHVSTVCNAYGRYEEREE